MASFSRLQLAAALLEYDNDPDDPTPQRSAQNSAIFSHIRTRNAPRARNLSGFEHLRETPNHLGVELPRSEIGSAHGSVDARRSLVGTRNSRGSIDMLRNPFGGDAVESEQGAEEQYEEDLEVDLEAWGMADFLGTKDKQGSKNRRSGPRVRQLSKAQSEMLPYSRPAVADEFGRLEVSQHRQKSARSQSMGGFGSSDQFLEAMRRGLIASEADFRRRSIIVPLDSMGRKTPDIFERGPIDANSNQPLSNRTVLRDHPSDLLPQTIPFPTSPPDPGEDPTALNSFALPLTSPTSRFDPKAIAHTRTMSHASLGSHMILDHGRERTMSDAAPPLENNLYGFPPPFSTSRFDPKAIVDTRPLSSASMSRPSTLDPRERVTSFATLGTTRHLDDDNPFSLPPPSPTRTSRFDPKAAAHARTMSTASLGSRLPSEYDPVSMISGQPLDQDHRQTRRYSRMELMRPKVLIMPSPLQGSEDNFIAPQVPDGFQLSTVGPPLPPGAKSAGRPISHLTPSMSGLRPDVESFTPNPRVCMSLSQLTFRNSLMVGGQRDVAYEDIEGGLRRAQEDGEQIYQEEDIEEEIKEEQKQAQGKAPGKLYGRSLMDELEARKEKMRSKQRVFTGDQRPSMMLRGQIRRSSTLIDPATLQDPPVSKSPGDRSVLVRRSSSGSKPLLDFSGEVPLSQGTGNGRIANSKSVFGVDQLWERELAKLKEIEAAEKAEEEERKRKEDEKAAKKARGKGKGNKALPVPSSSSQEVASQPSKIVDLPPTLPVIAKTSAKRPRPPAIPDSDSDTDSEASENEAKANAARRGSQVEGWGSSDDEGIRKSHQNLGSESEDDVPLARRLGHPSIRALSPDSEDEKPLAMVLEQKSILPDISFDNLLTNSDPRVARESVEEDDTPLAIRHPRARTIIAQSVNNDDDDDDRPLGLQQAQQLQQAQFNLMAQQQMMMRTHLSNSLAFGAPSMLNGFSPFMMAPAPFNGLPGPPIHDPAKYQSVDQWRHNVAAD